MRFLTLCTILVAAATVSGTTLLRGAETSRKLRDRTLVIENTPEELDDTTTTTTKHMCHEIGTYQTAPALVGNTETVGMLCFYPRDTNETSPLLSFAHGAGGGGLGIFMYARMLERIASSGFVVCAYGNCWDMCPTEWPKHQLNVITAAKEFEVANTSSLLNITETTELTDIAEISKMTKITQITEPTDPTEIAEPAEPTEITEFPIREGDVGVIGYSSGGVSALLSAMNDTAHEYSIGAAVFYDGDGAHHYNAFPYFLNVDLGDIDPSLPMLFAASTESADLFGVPAQCQDHAKPNAQWLLEENPDQPLLVACMDRMDHLDPVDIFSHVAPMLAVPYIVAFFGYALDPSDTCIGDYERILGGQLQNISSVHYFNNLF